MAKDFFVRQGKVLEVVAELRRKHFDAAWRKKTRQGQKGINQRFLMFVFVLLLCMAGCSMASPETQDKINHRIATKPANGKGVGLEMATAENDKQELQDLYHTMWQHMLSKNIAELGKLHDDNFVLTHMTGMRQNKKEYLAAIEDGNLNYISEKTENIIIDVKDGKGTLTGQSRVLATVFGGSEHVWPLQLHFEVERKDGKWILKECTASTY